MIKSMLAGKGGIWKTGAVFLMFNYGGSTCKVQEKSSLMKDVLLKGQKSNYSEVVCLI